MTNLHLPSEPDCPVPADMLARLYRSDTGNAASLVERLPETQRIELAMFCYSRAHLRPLAMSIATKCDPSAMMRLAGNAGFALATQCQQLGGTTHRTRISLAGSRQRADGAGTSSSVVH